MKLLQEETAGPPRCPPQRAGTALALQGGGALCLTARPIAADPAATTSHASAQPSAAPAPVLRDPQVPPSVFTWHSCGGQPATREPSGWPLYPACPWLLSETWLLRKLGGETKNGGGGAVARIQDLWEEVTTPAPGLGYLTPPCSPTCH